MVEKRHNHDLKLMVIIVIVAVLALSIFGSTEGSSGTSITGNVVGDANAIPPPLCEDSDGGLDYSTKGSVSGVLPKGFRSEDVCIWGVFLREVYCKDNQPASHITYCRSGCSNGVCKEKKIVPRCGNGAADSVEQCDGADLKGNTCNSLGFIGGALSCSRYCVLNMSGCIRPVCGNGVKEINELCDGNDLNNKTCRTFGFISGTLKCDSKCKFDTTECVKACTSDSQCGEHICAEGKVQETCENGKCILKSRCTTTKCAKEGEYTSGSVSPQYQFGCCEGLKSFNPHPDRVGGGNLCYDPAKGLPACKNMGTRSEGWYYPKNGALLKYDTCSGATCGNGICEAGEQDHCDTVCPPDQVCAAVCIIGTCPQDCVNVTACTDSDGGKNYNLKGTCYDKNYVTGVSDKCSDRMGNILNVPEETKTYVVEYYCQDNACVWSGTAVPCPNGCKDGACVTTRCAKEGEYTSGTVAPEYQYGCCEGLKSFYPDRNLVGGGSLCFDPNKGEPVCRSSGTSTEGWYYPKTGELLKYGKCCNNGIIDPGEECDGAQLNGMTCAKLGFYAGILGCTSGCKFDLRGCINQMPCRTYMDCPQIATIPEYMECNGNSLCRITGGYDCVNSACVLNKKYYDCLNCTGGCKDGACLKPVNYCGNYYADVGEHCDLGPNGGTVIGITCSQVNSAFIPNRGSVRCTRDCKFDMSGCSSPIGYCGDGLVSKPNSVGINESCDGNNLDGKRCTNFGSYVGGTLRCRGDCSFDFTNCTGPPPRCGDGAVNQQTEECDGGDLKGMTCTALGFVGGTLRCNSHCLFDTTGCLSPLNYCGNARLEPGEQCDSGSSMWSLSCSAINSAFTGGSLSCSRNCMYNTSNCIGPAGGWCGDGIVSRGEQCEGTVGNRTCRTFGFAGGTLRCNNCLYDISGCLTGIPPLCGDGVKNAASEDCDGRDFSGHTCTSLGYVSGTLRCNSACKFDTSGCVNIETYCGDNLVTKPNSAGFNEECDGVDFGGLTCQSLGYVSGTLRCSGDCKFDRSGCSSPPLICGDGMIQQPNSAGFNEQCDGTNLNSRTCTDFADYIGGTLRCSGSCAFDFSSCSSPTYCGDGARNQLSEECDSPDFGGMTCAVLGYTSGTLRCASDCKLDDSNCITSRNYYCGDGIIQQPNSAGFAEQCDGNALPSHAVCPPGYANYASIGSPVTCRGDCILDYSGCQPIIQVRCGDGEINQLSERCDTNDLGGNTCRSLGFDSGTLGCTYGCVLDTSDCRVTQRVCGDGIISAPNDAGFSEQCDGSVPTNTNCQQFGYLFGTVSCVNCMLNSETCSACNNNGVCQPRMGETAENCRGDCVFSPTGVALYLNPGSIDIAAGDTVTFDAQVSGMTNLFGYQFDINYDPEVLEFIGMEQGTFLSAIQSSIFCVDYTADPGLVKNVACVKTGGSGVSGNGLLKKISFRALARGISGIELSNVKLVDATSATIPVEVISGQVGVN